MTAAARYYARLEPIAFGDANNGLVLQALATALMAPRELFEIARDDATHIAWGQLLDPDACPAELLDWLAVQAGVVLPPSALSAQEKRDRIQQAAGQYRGTERAWVEEIQRALTGSKTVRIVTFVGGSQWAVAILTRTSETPDVAAVTRTALAAKPAGIDLTFIVSDNPIIAEGTRTIDAGAGTIDTATLADVT